MEALRLSLSSVVPCAAPTACVGRALAHLYVDARDAHLANAGCNALAADVCQSPSLRCWTLIHVRHPAGARDDPIAPNNGIGGDGVRALRDALVVRMETLREVVFDLRYNDADPDAALELLSTAPPTLRLHVDFTGNLLLTAPSDPQCAVFRDFVKRCHAQFTNIHVRGVL